MTHRAISILNQSMCSRLITKYRIHLDDNFHSDRHKCLVYQKMVAALPYGDDAIGLLCYSCRDLIRIGHEYVSKRDSKRPGKAYHSNCARRLNII
jgi:hypothetical protein